jgi:hypothetical protein
VSSNAASFTAPKGQPRKHWRLLPFHSGLIFSIWATISAAHAEGIPAPPLKSGQFVYTVPQGFDPPLIGKAGLDEIQREARRLHFPYYVVVAKEYGGSSTEQLSDALDELVDNWARNPNFNRATSSVAVLTYSPRKYRLLAGSKWRAQLGLEGQQGAQQFVDIFSSYTQGSSKDPKTGIIESMKALDAFVFESTDPKRLALKAETTRKERAARQLQETTQRLDTQIARVEGLLSQTQFLPSDTLVPRAALAKAREVRARTVLSEMATSASVLQTIANDLQALVDGKRRAYQQQIAAQERERRMVLEFKRAQEQRVALQKLKMWALPIGTVGLLLGLLFWQWRRFRDISSRFRKRTAAWEEALLNAANNHTRFFEERQGYTELATATGKTKEKYDEVTREVGAIYPTIEAMRDRIAQCKQIFETGSFFRTGPLRQALDLLEAEFEFDTETMHRKSLFEPPVRIIKIKPELLQRQLDHQYTENIADWNELMQALTLRETIAQDAFPTSGLATILDLASQKNIPHRWFSSHPLFGDHESDRRFYDDLNALRVADPLAYKQRIDAAKQAQSQLSTLLNQLTDAMALVESKRVRVLPSYGETVVAPLDDPAVALASAFRADEKLTGFLASKSAVEEVEEQARLTADLYSTALEQAATLQAAIQGVQSDIATLASRLDSLLQLESQAHTRLRQAQAVHADTAAGAALLESGQRSTEMVRGMLQDARHLVEQKRHLDAQKLVQHANATLGSSQKSLEGCIDFCNELDAQKRAYEREVAGLEAAREAAETSLRRYGRSSRLNDFNGFYGSGPANYNSLRMQVTAYQQELDDEVRRARRDYEEEQARIERAREEERRRERDEARRRSSASSFSSSSSRSGSSSSSGSSWSGRSSSSSGTDW